VAWWTLSAGDTSIAAEAGPPAVQPKAPAVRTLRDIRPWLILPAVAAVAIVSLFPIAYALFYSLQPTPSGFEAINADPRFWETLRRTLILASIALPVELLLGLALACVFIGRMPGRAIFVSVLALPALVAPVISGSAWRMLFDNDYGPVNYILSMLSGRAVMTLWTEDPEFAFRAILIADIWQWTPFMVVLMLAALMNVDRGQLDMAAIDDAGPWRTLLRVVLPAIWPAVAIAVVIRGLDLLRLFDVVWVLTRGGPDGNSETISFFAYDKLMQGMDIGATAAMAVGAVAGLSLVAALLLTYLGRAP
jgi:multiple sugar transport system permease protein